MSATAPQFPAVEPASSERPTVPGRRAVRVVDPRDAAIARLECELAAAKAEAAALRIRLRSAERSL